MTISETAVYLDAKYRLYKPARGGLSKQKVEQIEAHKERLRKEGKVVA